MSRQAIILKAEAGTDTGMGHFMRCLAMAQMLSEKHDCSFAITANNPLLEEILKKENIRFFYTNKNNDLIEKLNNLAHKPIVVLDGYHFDIEFQRKIRSTGSSLIFIDDLIGAEQVADVIINPADSAKASDYKVRDLKIFCGHDHALLRASFLHAASNFKKEPVTKIRSVFVCFGASDPMNISGKIISNLEHLPEKPNIHLVTSTLNKHLDRLRQNKNIHIHTDLDEQSLCDLIKTCDLAICSPSTISQECACIGIPMLCLMTADNQKGIYTSLVERQLCIPLGNGSAISEQELKISISNALLDLKTLNDLVSRQKKEYDGKNADRIRNIINGIKLTLKKVTTEDSELLYKWANDPITRANSYKTELITREEHEKWFNSRISDASASIYIFYQADIAIGTVQIQKKEAECIIGISVAKDHRGKNLSAAMLQMACLKFLEESGDTRIFAYIKTSNTASLKAFEKAGFKLAETLNVQGSESYKMVYSK